MKDTTMGETPLLAFACLAPFVFRSVLERLGQLGWCSLGRAHACRVRSSSSICHGLTRGLALGPKQQSLAASAVGRCDSRDPVFALIALLHFHATGWHGKSVLFAQAALRKYFRAYLLGKSGQPLLVLAAAALARFVHGVIFSCA